MPITQIIYASRPFGFDAALLAGILMDARRCNTRDGITGALICRDDLFLHGPERRKAPGAVQHLLEITGPTCLHKQRWLSGEQQDFMCSVGVGR
jgi:hypothetical protein